MGIGNIQSLKCQIRRLKKARALSILSLTLGTLFLTVNCQEYPFQESCMDCEGQDRIYKVGQFDRLSINRLSNSSSEPQYLYNRIEVDLNTGNAKLYHDEFEVRACSQNALTRLLLQNIDQLQFSESLRTDFYCTMQIKDQDVFSSGSYSIDARGCGVRYLHTDARETVDALYSAYWDICQ